MFAAGVSAWGETIETFGSSTKVCGAWDASSKSSTYTLQKGRAVTITFNFSTNTDEENYPNWEKWYTWLIDAKCSNTTDAWWAFRGDNMSSSVWQADGITRNVEYSDNFETMYTRANMNECTVVLKVERYMDNKIKILATTTKGTETWVKSDNFTLPSSAADNDLTFYFTGDNCYGEITNVEYDTLTGFISCQVDIDFSNEINNGVIEGTKGSLSVGSGEITNNGEFQMTGDNNTVTIASEEYAGKRDIVNVSFDLCIGNVTNRQTWFYMYGSDDQDAGYLKVGVYSGTMDSNLGFDSSSVVKNAGTDPAIGNRTHFEVVLNYATSTITTTITPYTNGTAGTATTQTVSMINSNPLKKIKFGDNYNTRYSLLDNLVITTTKGDYSISEVGYTVQFVDGDGNAVKADDTTREALAGVSVSYLATTADKTTFYNDGDIANNNTTEFAAATNKYVFNNVSAVTSSTDDTPVTELVDGAVITIVYDKYNKYNYAVKQKLGDAEATDRATGTLWGDQTYRYYFPKGIKSGDNYYFTTINAASPYFGGDVTVDNPNPVINYVLESNIAYYSEGEDIETKAGTFTNFKSDMANGSCGAYSNATMTTLGAGTYQITARCVGRKSDRFVDFYKSSKTDENRLHHADAYTDGKVTTSGIFVLTENTDIIVDGGTVDGGANGNGLDYVIIKQIPGQSVSVTTAGYATYVNSDYDLDFSSSDIKAYKVKVNTKGVATLTQVDQVPSGTPVLLYKEGGATESIPVTTGAAAVTENDLVAGTGGTVATIDGDYTNMILNNVSGIGFYYANGQTVATNRAYLHILTTLAPDAEETNARMRFEFGNGEATGIENIATEQNTFSKGIYTLSGQRVSKPSKGLYIIDGKKVMVK